MDQLKNIVSEFSHYVKYPVVIFARESGDVIDCNYEAATLLGKTPVKIVMHPDKALENDEFWEKLESKGSLIWHRIHLAVDGTDHYVSGLINCVEVDGTKAYMLFFEPRAGQNLGSVSLERMINHTGLVAIFLYKENDAWKIRYISENIRQFGYTQQQFYEGKIKYQDIIHPKDLDRMMKEIRNFIKNGLEHSTFRFRLVTETKETRIVDADVHCSVKGNGEIESMEYVIRDITDEQMKASEATYLQSAIEKSESYVLVEHYEGKERKVVYISDNAVQAGINTEAMRKGYRLAVDYVHPDDRNKVLDTIYKAIDASVFNFHYEFRVVGDDGKVRWVKAYVTQTPLNEKEVRVEYLMTDITEQKELEIELLNQQKDLEKQIHTIIDGDNSLEAEDVDFPHIIKEQKLDEMLEGIANVTKLYSAIVDLDGRHLTKPEGPAEFLGDFYDLFERPAYKEIYKAYNEELVRGKKPIIADLGSGYPEGKFAGAPIMMGGKHIATWVLCAYTNEESRRLIEGFRGHYAVVMALSNYLHEHYMFEDENKANRLAKMQFEEVLEEKQKMMEMMDAMRIGGNKAIDRMCGKTSRFLDIPEIDIVKMNRENGKFEFSLAWNNQGIEKDTIAIDLSSDTYKSMLANMKGKECVVMSSGDIPGDVRIDLVSHQVYAFILYPIRREESVVGYIVFIENRRSRNWTRRDTHFTQIAARLIEETLEKISGNGDMIAVNRGFLQVMDRVDEIVIVSDYQTEEILYMNKAGAESFGGDLIGEKASRLLNHSSQTYSVYGYAGNHQVSLNKESSYDTYIPMLNQTKHVVEIPSTWNDGRKVRLSVLKTEDYQNF